MPIETFFIDPQETKKKDKGGRGRGKKRAGSIERITGKHNLLHNIGSKTMNRGVPVHGNTIDRQEATHGLKGVGMHIHVQLLQVVVELRFDLVDGLAHRLGC